MIGRKKELDRFNKIERIDEIIQAWKIKINDLKFSIEQMEAWKVELKEEKIDNKLWKCHKCNSIFTPDELYKQGYTCSKCGATVFTK